MADANLTQLGYVAETTFGTTPAESLQILRTTGGAITPTQEFVISEEIRSDLRAGRPVRTSQMANGDINVEWSYGTLDGILEGMLMEDWASDVLVDGTTKKSFTFEDQFTGLDTPLYNTFKGSRIASVSMSVTMGSIVTGSFGIMAATPDLGNTSSEASGTTAATTTGPWNAVDMVETLTEGASGGSLASLAKMTSVELNITRDLRTKGEIGSLNPFDIGTGRLVVNGTLTQYFEDASFLTQWAAFNDRELDLQFNDEDGNTFLVNIPKMKYVGDLDVENPGVDSDRMVTANFEAYATATDNHVIRFTRTAA